ncbi:MAG: hypothetical protein ACXACO_06555 [Promethearchaeota archaeon]
MRNLQLNKAQQKTFITIRNSLVLGVIVLLIGLIIGFFIFNLGLSNPILFRIGIVYDQQTVERILRESGFYDPLPLKFLKYFGNFFSGNWGESFVIMEGRPVTEMMKTIIPKTIESLMIPMLIGLIGIKIGRIWVKKRNKIQGFLIFIFTVMGLALPLFLLIPWLQYTFGILIQDITNGLIDLPIVYYASPALTGPPLITGFPLFDSIVTGNWEFAGSIIEHGILPTIALSFVVLVLIIKQTQTNIERNSKGTPFLSNSLTAGKLFGILFTFVLITEMAFNRTGFAYYFISAIYSGDLFFLNGCILMIIVFFSLTMFFSNILPLSYTFIRKKIRKRSKPFRERLHERYMPYKEKLQKFKTNHRVKLNKDKIAKLKKLLRKIGLGLLIIGIGLLAIITVFPQFLTPYTLQEITRPFIPMDGVPFDPPSPDHPLGTTRYGYDVLALVLYGTQDALIFGIGVTLIGLAGGSIFGLLAGKSRRKVHNIIIGSMLAFFIIPGLLLIIFWDILLGEFILNAFLGMAVKTSVVIIGFLLIPIFTKIIANTIRRESNYRNVIKVIVKNIPLEMAFGILLYLTLGFLGMGNQTQLGTTINYGFGHHFSAMWAVLWPGFFIFFILLSLLLVYESIKVPQTPSEILEKQRYSDSTISNNGNNLGKK